MLSFNVFLVCIFKGLSFLLQNTINFPESHGPGSHTGGRPRLCTFRMLSRMKCPLRLFVLSVYCWKKWRLIHQHLSKNTVTRVKASVKDIPGSYKGIWVFAERKDADKRIRRGSDRFQPLRSIHPAKLCVYSQDLPFCILKPTQGSGPPAVINIY